MRLLSPRRRVPPSRFKQNGSMLINPFAFGGGVPTEHSTFHCRAIANTDTVNNLIWQKLSNMSGVADGKTFLFSLWFYNTIGEFSPFDTIGGNAFLDIGLNAGQGVRFDVFDSSAAQLLRIETTADANPNAWNHVLAKVDMAGTCQIYLNDVSDCSVVTQVNSNIQWSLFDEWDERVNEIGIGADNAWSEFFLAVGQSLDLSVTANRRKFIDASGFPVSLGATGSTPTGTAPTVYQHLAPGDAASVWRTNQAGHGNYPAPSSGTEVVFATSPSFF